MKNTKYFIEPKKRQSIIFITKLHSFKRPHGRGEHDRFYPKSGLTVSFPSTIVREDLLPFITKDGFVITKDNILNNITHKIGKAS